ncbi:MAG: SDR family oxidoreductase [Cypionkella sp.]
MQLTGNTILITGGGSGIGRGLAEAFHQRGNQVIISGRRQSALDEVIAANPGMVGYTLDIADKADVADFAARVVAAHPSLNAVINNAGIMVNEDVVADAHYLDTAEATIATNLLGPIRLTAALLPHLQRQPKATVLMVSSGLAFVSLAVTPTYSATKAAIHAYAQSLRHLLRQTTVDVIELAPPYVQTMLQGVHQASDPHAMPLDAYLAETMDLLGAEPANGEILVERVKPLRFADATGNGQVMFDMLNPK